MLRTQGIQQEEGAATRLGNDGGKETEGKEALLWPNDAKAADAIECNQAVTGWLLTCLPCLCVYREWEEGPHGPGQVRQR